MKQTRTIEVRYYFYYYYYDGLSSGRKLTGTIIFVHALLASY